MKRARAWAVAVAFGLAASPAAAGSLAGRLHDFVEQNTSIFVVGGVADFVTPAIERLAVRGVDFPSTATAPGFTYRFDFATGSYVREATGAGPVFAERPETLGGRRFEAGVSLVWGDLDRVDGGSFGTASTGRFRVLADGEPLDVLTALTFDEFSLRTTVIGLGATYGLSDRWDVNVLVPLVHTALDVRATRVGAVFDASGARVASLRTVVGTSGEAFGVGDVLVRTKYRVFEGSIANVALGLTFRAPTGAEEDFHGLGDWTVTPLVVAGRELGRVHLHGTLGAELNADDAERDRLRYALGASTRLWKTLGVFTDVLGSSGVVDDEFTLTSLFPAVLAPPRGVGVAGTRRAGLRTTTTAFVPRSDLVDVAVGFKLEALGRLVAFAGAIVPVTDDGLRADVLPTAGVQLGF